MSDDIFGENNKSINWASMMLITLLIIVIIGIGLYSTGHLNIGGINNNTPQNTTGNTNQNNTNTGVTTEELTENETQSIKNSVVQVLIPKYVVYKTTEGDVLGVTGFIAVKTKYYQGMGDSLVIGLKNYPVRKTIISKKLYSKDYHGYVIYKFTITFKDTIDKTLKNLKTLQVLVIYNNIPNTFNIDMTKNVIILKSNYNINMDYILPLISNTPVQASITFTIITNSQSLLNKIKNNIINNYQSSYIVLEGDEKYFMKASTYSETSTSVTIQYISSPSVLTGVYDATLYYKILGNTITKKLHKILVNNPNSYPDFISIGLITEKGQPLINKINGKYWILLQVNDTTNKVVLPKIIGSYYDYNLNKISDVSENNVPVNFGVNTITLQIPDKLITSPGKYYLILKITDPSDNKYSVLINIDTEKVNIKSEENEKISNITYMLYPQEGYYNQEQYEGFNTTITGKIPLLIYYPSNQKTITVKVMTPSGTQTVQLNKLIDYKLSDGSIAPLYGGFFTVIDEKPVSNYEVTVQLPDGEKVWGSVNLMNILLSSKVINSIYNTEMIKTSSNSQENIQTKELTVYKIIAVARGLTSEYDLTELLTSLLNKNIIFTQNDVRINGDKLIIHIDDGTAGKLLSTNFITYKTEVLSILRSMTITVRQNENLYYNIILPAEAEYSNKSIIITIPFINKMNHVYINVNDNIIPLSKFIKVNQPQTNQEVDYTYLLYLDPSIKLTSEDEVYSMYNSIFNDNPISREILLEKLNTITLILSYIQQPESNYNETNTTPVNYTNTTMAHLAGEGNETQSYLHIYIGLDSKPTGTPVLTVNGHSIPVKMSVQKYLDFYLADVQVKYGDFESAVMGLSLKDITSGKEITRLTISGHTYINIMPGEISTRGFLISDNLLFINSEGYKGVLYCGNTSIDPIYSVSVNGFTGAVYQLSPECNLKVKSDLFGEYKVFP